MRMMTKTRICDRWAEYCYHIYLSIHGTARFWAAKRGAFCMHALMTGALLGTSKQAMHRASWVRMKIGVGYSAVLYAFERTVLYDCMALPIP